MGRGRVEQLILSSPEEMEEFGKKIVQKIPKDATIALFGELGAGKTTLVRGMVRGVGIDPAIVSSPTFVILNVYDERIFHFDLYRLKSEMEFFHSGFDEILEGPGLKIIEWAERIASELPSDAVVIHIRHGFDENRRHLEMRFPS